MDFSNQRDKTLIQKEKGKVHQIFIENIVYIECEGYISSVHTCDERRPVTCSILLKEIEEKINGNGFFRINRNTIVNLKYLESFVSGKRRCFFTKTGLEMRVSRRKWSDFRNEIGY
jgi:two-component system, LytTR family, response regulator